MKTKIIRGDVTAVLRKIPSDSFDSVLTDPPYGLSSTTGSGGGFMGMKWDSRVPGPEVWAEVLRVLKPGGFMLAFGGTRTFHRLTCAIEDAGFEVRDVCCWLYGSGFPKSLDIAQAIDRKKGRIRARVPHPRGGGFGDGISGTYAQDPWTTENSGTRSDRRPLTKDARTFDGYGTALKPAWEPILVCMKPCEGTFAENAAKWCVAGLNIDAGRIGTADKLGGGATIGSRANHKGWRRPWMTDAALNSAAMERSKASVRRSESQGRWPANLILDEHAAELLDAQTGTLKSGANPNRRSSDKFRNTFQPYEGGECIAHRGADSGGASRFFYVAKASKKERGIGNTHPTVKPIKLAQYLATLLLPPNQGKPRRLLVPFSGSGSEILGAKLAGWEYVLGIDNSAEYVAIAESRLKKAAA